MAISRQKTNDALETLCYEVLENVEFNQEGLIRYQNNSEGDIVAVEYDTRVLNDILEKSLKTIRNSLEALSLKEKDPLLHEVFFEDGIIYEVPIGYLTGIAFLQNWGYRLKVELPLFHYINGSLSIESEEYGINSSLITIYLNLDIKAEVITSIYVQDIQFVEKFPLIIQIVQGDVPSFSSDTKKD